MHASFFPPIGPVPEPPEQPEAPAWFQAPRDEFPVRVLVREFLGRTPATAVIVSHVDVYSTGIRITVDWELRRTGDDDTDWRFVGHPAHGIPGSDPEHALRFGLALADGSVVTTVDRALGRAWDEEPDGWSLMDQLGGGGGDAHRFSGSSSLWLWPLPPAGPIELVGEWVARGVPESRLILDGTDLLARTGEVRSLWG